jgi:MFS family permease
MPPSIQRDRLTWLLYLVLAYFTYMQVLIGPITPFIREELKLTYTTASLHFTALALGMILSGLSGDRLSARLGRYRLLWLGTGGMALGAALLAWGDRVEITIFSTFVMGLMGTWGLVMFQAISADYQREFHAVAMAEAFLMAGIGLAAPPLLVGLFEESGIGWRGAVAVGVGLWLLMLIVFHKDSIPTGQASRVHANHAGRALPLIFWLYWLLIFLGVAIEWSLIAWGADFLQNHLDIGKVLATTLMSLFLGMFIVGRWFAARIVRRVSSGRLVLLAISCVALGFFPFWLIPVGPVSIIGLMVTGLGASNLVPLGFTLAGGSVSEQLTDVASSRVALSGGSAILIAPLILGSLADWLGIASAYSVVIVILAAMFVLMMLVNRITTSAMISAQRG